MSLNPVDFVRRCFSLVLVLPFPRFSPSVQNLPFGTQTRATFDRPRERDLRLVSRRRETISTTTLQIKSSTTQPDRPAISPCARARPSQYNPSFNNHIESNLGRCPRHELSLFIHPSNHPTIHLSIRRLSASFILDFPLDIVVIL